jgi:hypothetical protein
MTAYNICELLYRYAKESYPEDDWLPLGDYSLNLYKEDGVVGGTLYAIVDNEIRVDIGGDSVFENGKMPSKAAKLLARKIAKETDESTVGMTDKSICITKDWYMLIWIDAEKAIAHLYPYENGRIAKDKGTIVYER